MKRIIGHFGFSLLVLFLPVLQPLLAQPYSLPDEGVDVLYYHFMISLDEQTDSIDGTARLRIKFTKADIQTLSLDLIGQSATSGGKGMKVREVFDTNKLEYTHEGEKLTIDLGTPTKSGEERVLNIKYGGIPVDGLIISKNKYEDRTFFGDNWPNRAHNWLPVVDHPADKALVDFSVTALQKYQVIANGRLLEETDLPGGDFRLTRWGSTRPIPTKVMVLGAAEFAVEYLGEYNKAPVSSWVYPQNKRKGFHDYEVAIKVLNYFVNYIGPYPYAKLANVQSKTRFGGMENASNIFYAEESVTGDRSSESLIAHEVAHQWFGNSATEADWPHIWLSEGFATYFAAMYMENVYGKEKLKEILAENRQTVLSRGPNTAVVPKEIPNLMFLLNANSYQKGGWVLHMLRRQLGDSLFQAGIRSYYDRYQHSNATTENFRNVMEEVSGQNLNAFFQQWLHRAGNPALSVRWDYEMESKKAVCIFNQTQSGADYSYPLKVRFVDEEGKILKEEVCKISNRKHRYEINLAEKPAGIICDPDVDVLVDISVVE